MTNVEQEHVSRMLSNETPLSLPEARAVVNVLCMFHR